MLVRSTLFSRLSYMSRENTDLATELADVQKKYEELLKKYNELEKISKVNCKYFWGFEIK